MSQQAQKNENDRPPRLSKVFQGPGNTVVTENEAFTAYIHPARIELVLDSVQRAGEGGSRTLDPTPVLPGGASALARASAPDLLSLAVRQSVPFESLIVQKYGGSSVADSAGVRRAARRIAETLAAGYQVIVVVSAMGDTTDELSDLAAEVSPRPHPRDLDALLTTGELVSTSLLAIALADLGVVARIFTGSKAGPITDNIHGNAHITDVKPDRIRACLERGETAIVAGFQGRTRKKKTITTLGRGGSDITAVALAAALGASICEIYTDVDGVYTADPRIVPTARKIDVPVREQAVITGVAGVNTAARITVVGIPDQSGRAAGILHDLAESGLNVEMIVQNARASDPGRYDMAFTLPASEAPATLDVLGASQTSIGFQGLFHNDHVGKVSLAGLSMRSSPDIFCTFFRALADEGIDLELIEMSEICIAAVMQSSSRTPSGPSDWRSA